MPSWIAAALMLLAVGTAQAGTTYCCSDAEGRQVCADRLPPQCIGRPYRELNERGVTIRQFGAVQPADASYRTQDPGRREHERTALDLRRRDRALLDTYSSEQEISQLRDRRLREADEALVRARRQFQEAQGRAEPKASESELRQLDALAKDRQRDIDAIKTRFEDDRRRFAELSRNASR